MMMIMLMMKKRNVLQSDNSTPYLARHVGHLSGVKKTVPALTVNRLVYFLPCQIKSGSRQIYRSVNDINPNGASSIRSQSGLILNP